MNAYINHIGLDLLSIYSATAYIGNAAHKNHLLHTIIGPKPLGPHSIAGTRDEIINRGDRYNAAQGERREIYAAWHVFALSVGVFPSIEDLNRIGKAGGDTLAPDGNGYLAIHYNPHSGAADINWIVSAFHFSPLLKPRRNRRLNEEAQLRNVINAESETLNATRPIRSLPTIPLLRPPTSNRLEAKVAALAAHLGVTVDASTLPGLLATLEARFSINADLLHVSKTDSGRTTFTTPIATFVREVKRLLSPQKMPVQRPNLNEGVSTLFNEWRRCAISPAGDRAMEQFEPKME